MPGMTWTWVDANEPRKDQPRCVGGFRQRSDWKHELRNIQVSSDQSMKRASDDVPNTLVSGRIASCWPLVTDRLTCPSHVA